MSLSNEQFQERLVDYLYGELEGEELRAFEAHLRESEASRRELAALQSTLRTARAGLAEAIDEAPPARVRGALFAAAEAQLRAAEPARAAPAARVDERGVFLRWLSAAWLVPTLGVVAAVTLVVFGKNLQSPSVRVDGPSARPSEAPPEQSPAVAPPSAAASESKVDEKREQPGAEVQHAPAHPSRSSPARGHDDGFAKPPPAWNPKRAEASDAPRGPGSVSAPATTGATRESNAEAEREEAPHAQDKAPAALGEARDGRADRRGAAPAKSAGASDLDRQQEAAAPAAPAAPAAAAPAPVDDALAAPANEAQRSRAQAGRARAPDDLVRRAGEHVTARRWQQAAADYRDLLRRYPNDVRVSAWKKQLVLATQALHGPERAPP